MENKKITIGTFDCRQLDIDSVVRALESGYLSTGKELKKFEEIVSSYHNKKYGIMVNSGQSALEVALVLAKVKLKKLQLNVVVPTTTYAATLWAILNTNNNPIFCDIGEDYNLNIIDNEDIIWDDIDVILAVDLCGKTCHIPDNLKHKFIIKDACEAFGNKEAAIGDIVCHSFYVSHIITCGSGGMLILDDEELYNYGSSYIAHGRTMGGDFTKNTDKWIDKFVFDKVGVSYRSDNLSGALGLSQFNRTEDIIKKRKENAKYLIDNQSESINTTFWFPPDTYWKDCVFQFFPVLINKNMFRGSRNDFLTYLFNNNIDSRVLLSLTNQDIFKKLYGDISWKYEHSDYCNENGFVIGCHQDLTTYDMQYVLDIFENYDL